MWHRQRNMLGEGWVVGSNSDGLMGLSSLGPQRKRRELSRFIERLSGPEKFVGHECEKGT